MLGDDPVRDGEAEPGALADRLGGEERLEYARQVLARDAASLVLDCDAEVVAFGAAGLGRGTRAPDAHRDPEPPAVRHRLNAVHEHVREHLLHLALIETSEHRGTRDTLDPDLRTLGRGGNEFERARDQLFQVGETHLRAPPSREVEQLLDDAGHPVGLLENAAPVGGGVGG